MATTAVGGDLPTLLDMHKRMDPNGAIARVVELLQARSAILGDMVVQEGNLPTGHIFTSRTKLPAVTWRRFNEGVAPDKSLTDQVTDTCGMLSALAKVDVELANLNGNAPAFRASEDAAYLQACNQDVESGLFYYSTKTAPSKFMGLAPRYNATTDPYGSQIVKADTSPSGSDQTSIFGVVWGPESVFAIHPKGNPGGLQHTDRGILPTQDANGNEFFAYVSEWTWKIGLCVKDPLQVVRVCNIDTSAISSSSANIIPAMVKAYYKLQNPNGGRLVWYCNRTVATYLHLQALAAVANSTLSIEKIGGQPITTFLGSPIRVTDAILNTEAIIS